MNSVEDYDQIRRIALEDVDVLEEKGSHYGRSWVKRGGIGAFMMLARKWDRLENVAERNGYEVFQAIEADPGPEGVLESIRDLRRYLLLVESEYLTRCSRRAGIVGASLASPGGNGAGYGPARAG